MLETLRRALARAIIIDRATPDAKSLVGRIARERSEENYRFAARFVAGKSVLDIGGGTGLGHTLLLQAGAASILSLDAYVAGPVTKDADPKVRFVKGDFLTQDLPESGFDVIVCLGTLFYLKNGEAALARMRRLLRPGGTLIINCINQELIRRYFRMRLEDIDGKFAAAYDEAGLRAFLRNDFPAEPEFYVQQPVPLPHSLPAALGFWLIPLTWPYRRHPVMRKPAGAEGMYVYAVVTKSL